MRNKLLGALSAAALLLVGYYIYSTHQYQHPRLSEEPILSELGFTEANCTYSPPGVAYSGIRGEFHCATAPLTLSEQKSELVRMDAILKAHRWGASVPPYYEPMSTLSGEYENRDARGDVEKRFLFLTTECGFNKCDKEPIIVRYSCGSVYCGGPGIERR